MIHHILVFIGILYIFYRYTIISSVTQSCHHLSNLYVFGTIKFHPIANTPVANALYVSYLKYSLTCYFLS